MSDRIATGRLAATPLVLLMLAAALPSTASAQRAEGARRILSSEISLSREEASLTLGFESGQEVYVLRGGRLSVNGEEVAAAARGSELERSWRELLNRAMEAPTDQIAALLIAWQAPEAGAALDRRLEESLSAVPAQNVGEASADAQIPDAQLSDSMARLVDRVTRLQRELERLEDDRIVIPNVNIDIPDRRRGFGGPFRHFFAGLSGIFSNLILFAVLFGIAFATIFFGGRRYIEGVADTARAAPTRSALVGLAAAFLVVPAFILGIVALAISIVGIPALLLWIPLFPVAVGVAALLGYIGVAHAAGEALAERRFYAADWFQRGNAYYFIMTGLGLLLSLFVASHIVQMAGPWLGFLRSMLAGLGAVLTMAVMSIGLGAVLLSRAGTKPIRPKRSTPDPDVYAEATNV